MEQHKKSDLLEWESGKVKGFAGKNLIDLANGGLKMVKVDAFAIYPMHLHPTKTEFVFVLKGAPKIVIGENSYKGEKSDFFTLPKNIKHSIENPSDTECILLVGTIAD